MSLWEASAPCAVCEERIPLHLAKRCGWLRLVPTRVRVTELVVGDPLFMRDERKVFGEVLRVTPIEEAERHVVRVDYSRGARKAADRQTVNSNSTVVTLRPGLCPNYCCDLHCRELGPKRIVCGECWPLQNALITGDRSMRGALEQLGIS